MIVECERCRQTTECQFHGRAADEGNLNQNNGVWLCPPCVPLQVAELDAACDALESFLEEDE